jgi:acyl-CoA synthetase (AMP-forming)/AMP-acid ligase II
MDFLLERFATVPNDIAFIDNNRKVTYETILKTVNLFESIIKEKNIQPGDIVLLLGDYSPELFCFMLALAKNKNIIAPLSRESVVERSTIDNISESQWFVDFTDNINEINFEKINRVANNSIIKKLLEAGDPGLMVFSSGSTGTPKGILHNLARVCDKFHKPRKKTIAITFLMLDHFGGINTLLAITSSLGTVVTVKERNVKSICEAIEKHKLELLPTTPSFLNMLVHAKPNERYDLSSLKLITYGTEVMPQATLNRLREIFPNTKLQQTYGLSELGVLRSKSKEDGSLWVKMGGEGFNLKVVDDILWIKSEFAMLGYLNAPQPFDKDGWFNTQDKIEVDGEYFKILGRVTDLINVGGQKVYPAEIEEVILELDNIEDVAVFAEKNPLLGNIIVAKIKTNTEESLKDVRRRIRLACTEKLTKFKVPSKVIFAEDDLYSLRQKKIRSSQI